MMWPQSYSIPKGYRVHVLHQWVYRSILAEKEKRHSDRLTH